MHQPFRVDENNASVAIAWHGYFGTVVNQVAFPRFYLGPFLFHFWIKVMRLVFWFLGYDLGMNVVVCICSMSFSAISSTV